MSKKDKPFKKQYTANIEAPRVPPIIRDLAGKLFGATITLNGRVLTPQEFKAPEFKSSEIDDLIRAEAARILSLDDPAEKEKIVRGLLTALVQLWIDTYVVSDCLLKVAQSSDRLHAQLTVMQEGTISEVRRNRDVNPGQN